MNIYEPMAARLLRRFRLRRNLTLKQASPMLDTSSTTLSNKERGYKEVERADVRNAIEAYHLTPVESNELWLAAGFVPEQRIPCLSSEEICKLAAPILAGMTYPAALVDGMGYIRSWNSPYEGLWHLADTVPQPHVVDQLWLRQDRFPCAESWNRYAMRTLRSFYNSTLRFVGTTEFDDLIVLLCNRYGKEFTERWDEAQSYMLTFGPAEDWIGYDDSGLVNTVSFAMIHQYGIQYANQLAELVPASGRYASSDAECSTPVELAGASNISLSVAERYVEIQYVTTHSNVGFVADHELNIYMPFGEENEVRYAQWSEQIDSQQVHCA